MPWCPYVVGNASTAQAHPPVAVICVQAGSPGAADSSRGWSGGLGVLELTCCRGDAEAAGAEASTKALASAFVVCEGCKVFCWLESYPGILPGKQLSGNPQEIWVCVVAPSLSSARMAGSLRAAAGSDRLVAAKTTYSAS